MNTTKAKAAFVIPGDIARPTGGYAYDRRVLALLPQAGVPVRHVVLTGSYPAPTGDDLAATASVLASLPSDAPLLFDGLAYGALPADLVAGIRQPIVALCHHPLALEAGLSAAQQQHFRETETAALGRARHVVVTSRMTRQILMGDFGVAAHCITVAEPGTDAALRAAGSGDSGRIEMLAVGSIVPRKGYDVLVRALAGLAHHDWRLIIVGSDDLSVETTNALRASIATAGLAARITMIGAVGTADLDRLYAAADLIVMPSLFEGYGMVLAEAMARGLPIVCTTGGAAAETVPDAAALKVAPGNAGLFRDALAAVLGDRDLRRRMADAAWASGQRLPCWHDTTGIIAKVLKRVMC